MVRTLKNMTLLLLLPICSSVAMAQVGLSIHDTSGVSGAELTIPVYVDTSLTGDGVTAYQIQLSYSSSYMAFDGVVSTGSLTESLGSVSYNGSTPGTITIASAGSTALTGTGVLIYVRLKLLSAGYVSLTFSGGAANNFFNEGNPPMILQNGNINILPAPSITVYPPSGLLTVGDQEQFTAYSGTIPYDWSVTNPSVASIDANGLLSATHAGFTKVVAKDAVGTIDTTSGVVEIRAFKLSVPDTSYIQGQTFNLPIYTSDLTGLNVTAGSFQVQFDPSILTPIGVVRTGTLLASYIDTSNNSSSNLVNVTFAGSNPLSGSGVLLYLQFKVSKTNSGGSTVSPGNIVFNETISGNSASGNFQTINLSNVNVGPSSGTLIDGDTLRFTATGGTPPYSWSTSNSTVASIDNSGLLTALKGGTVTVQAQDTYGASGQSGQIQVYDTRITTPDTIDVIGGTINVPLYISPVKPGMHILSFQATINYDTSVIHFMKVVNLSTLTDGWSYSVNPSGTQLIFAAAGSSSINTAGILCKICFVVPAYVSSGNSSSLSIQQLLLNEGTPRPLLVNGSVTTALASVPASPTNLVATAINFGRIDLSWHDNANNETGYTLQRTLDTTTSWSIAASLAPDTTTYSDTGLNDGTRYFYRVYASNGIGNSGYSNIPNAITPMLPPDSLTAVQTVGEEVKLNWHDASSNESGFYIERKKGSAGTYSVIDSVGANVSTFTDMTGAGGSQYFYRVRGYNSFVRSAYSNEVNLTLTGIRSDRPGVPDKFDVSQNYPNPFNPSTKITYQLPTAGHVILKIFDALGREVATLVNDNLAAGYYDVTFNADRLPSGIYFYRLAAGGYVSVKKMVLMK